uniref:Uncharacterized protein n=1 Tax=Sphaerodactylus townsendi TaxID=933632 RepID=A0ACB8FRU7_9SAUR
MSLMEKVNMTVLSEKNASTTINSTSHSPVDISPMDLVLAIFLYLDRYVLVHYPVWSQNNRTISRAQRLIAGVWLTSLILSAPYLAFRETQVLEGGRIECVNNYALSSDWDAPEVKTLRSQIYLALFLTRLLLSFLIPFCIIMGCYCGMGWKMKKKRLARNGKPFKVLVVAVTSFFIAWAPYHLYHASLLFKKVPDEVQLYLRAIFIITTCLNWCVTPILYLFVGEKFQQVCKMSIRALLKKAFVEISILPEDDSTANGVANPNSNQSNL